MGAAFNTPSAFSQVAALSHVLLLFAARIMGRALPRPSFGCTGTLGGTPLRALILATVLGGGAAQVVVTSLAGKDPRWADGVGTLASFDRPAGLTVDGTGTIFVADSQNGGIRKVTQGGQVTTLAGAGISAADYIEGVGTGAAFNGPNGVAVDASGNVFVADFSNFRLRVVTASGATTTLAGSGSSGSADGTGASASFSGLRCVAIDGSGNLFACGGSRIRKVTPGGAVSTLAGGGPGTFADGTGAAAAFNGPSGVALDASGNVIVADTANNRVRRVTPGGVVTTLAGSGAPAFADGAGAGASFNRPCGVAVAANGDAFVTDQYNNRLRVVTPGGLVSTLAGNGACSAGGCGSRGGTFSDGVGTAAAFNNPYGVALDASGNAYIADAENNRIRKVTCASGTSSATGICCCALCTAVRFRPSSPLRKKVYHRRRRGPLYPYPHPHPPNARTSRPRHKKGKFATAGALACTSCSAVRVVRCASPAEALFAPPAPPPVSPTPTRTMCRAHSVPQAHHLAQAAWRCVGGPPPFFIALLPPPNTRTPC
jgi:sugar lactone lactonase YvrE